MSLLSSKFLHKSIKGKGKEWALRVELSSEEKGAIFMKWGLEVVASKEPFFLLFLLLFFSHADEEEAESRAGLVEKGWFWPL